MRDGSIHNRETQTDTPLPRLRAKMTGDVQQRAIPGQQLVREIGITGTEQDGFQASSVLSVQKDPQRVALATNPLGESHADTGDHQDWLGVACAKRSKAVQLLSECKRATGNRYGTLYFKIGCAWKIAGSGESFVEKSMERFKVALVQAEPGRHRVSAAMGQ